MEMGNIDKKQIFSMHPGNFQAAALSVFNFQFQQNGIYRKYCELLGRNPSNVSGITDIPFLPISFFKSHEIKSTDFKPEILFESSRTTGVSPSLHFVKDAGLYEESFLKTFQQFYGNVDDYCIIGLLPSYLERENSSLVYMVDRLIRQSRNKHSGFYLQNFKDLSETLKHNEAIGQRTLLIGVTFALLDFACAYPLPLLHTTIIETGGMKGRKKEQTREEVHRELQIRFNTTSIHSEYGMTELLSQAYATSNEKFAMPPWMKMLVREADDPFTVRSDKNIPGAVTGLGNVIDLANMYSCSFIATDDVVKLHQDATFEILGRSDNSDIRGCSLMVI